MGNIAVQKPSSLKKTWAVVNKNAQYNLFAKPYQRKGEYALGEKPKHAQNMYKICVNMHNPTRTNWDPTETSLGAIRDPSGTQMDGLQLEANWTHLRPKWYPTGTQLGPDWDPTGRQICKWVQFSYLISHHPYFLFQNMMIFLIRKKCWSI